MKNVDHKIKLKNFVKWLIKATNENNMHWRQDRCGQDLFTAFVVNTVGKAEINFLVSDGVKIIKIAMHKDVHIAPFSFYIASNDLTCEMYGEIDELYKAIIQKVKIPEWVLSWLDNVAEDI